MNDVVGAYDAVAAAYDEQLADELDHKPLDRSLLDAFASLVGSGVVADVGCGPGHVTRFLAETGARVVGFDLSPVMIEIARRRSPSLSFSVGSMLDLPVAASAWGGVVAFYSIIHLTSAERAVAFSEFARVLQPGGWALVSFHVSSPEFGAGEVNHLTEFFGAAVDLDGHFLAAAEVCAELVGAGFTIAATLEREPILGAEYPSKRCYLVAQLPDVR